MSDATNENEKIVPDSIWNNLCYPVLFSEDSSSSGGYNKNNPTIYYTTTDGSRISDDDTKLQGHILSSDTKMSNGERRIILDNAFTSIPEQCFCIDTKLKTIRFENFNNVNTIEFSFCSHCINLTSIRLLGLSNVIHIMSLFLSFNPKLTSIDLSSLSNVRWIGHSFLYGCSGLKTLVLPNTTNYERISETGFLEDCGNLEHIYCPPGTYDAYKEILKGQISEQLMSKLRDGLPSV